MEVENGESVRPRRKRTVELTKVLQKQIPVEPAPNLTLRSNESNLSLLGTIDQVVLFELNGYALHDQFRSPYNIYRAVVLEEEPIGKLINNISLEKIYSTSDATQRQHLALDPLFSLRCSRKPPKVRATLVDWVPWYCSTNQYCIILTSLGDCRLYNRHPMHSHFTPLKTNLNTALYEILPKFQTPISQINSFENLMNFVNRFYVTAFCSAPLDRFIYVATAAGFIVCLDFNPDTGSVKPMFYTQTELDHITYLKCYDEYMVVANIKGLVQLMKVDHKAANEKIRPVIHLWEEEDRIPCHKVIISEIEYLHAFMIVFYKSASVIARVVTSLDIKKMCYTNVYRITNTGQHLVSGSKITGIEALSSNEYIVSVIAGFLIKVKVDFGLNNKLEIKDEPLMNKFGNNMNIISFVCSENNIFWSLLLTGSNKSNQQMKNNKDLLYLKFFKVKVQDPLKPFLDTDKIRGLDILLGIKLDIISNEKQKRNYNYVHVLNESMEGLRDPLPLLQAGYFMAYQRREYLCVRSFRAEKPFEMEFLQAALQILIIRDRLCFLQSIAQLTTLNTFQRVAIKCMQYTYAMRIRQIKATTKYAPSVMKDLVYKFLLYATKEWRNCTFRENDIDTTNIHMTSECDLCQEKFNSIQSEQCASGHYIPRCAISCTPMSITAPYVQCVICKARFLPISSQAKLMQLYGDEDGLRNCPYCQGGIKATGV